MAITTIRTEQLRDKDLFFWRDGSAAMTGNIDMGTNKIINLEQTPTNPGDAASKWYVDQIASGIDPTNPAVKLVSADNIASLNGTTTIDGVSANADDRVLLNGQTDASENGVWIVKAGAWERPADWITDTAENGDFYFVEQGDDYAKSGWVCTTDNPITVDTTEVNFSQISQAVDYTEGNGINISGNQISAKAEAGGAVVVNAGGINLNPIVVAGTHTKITYDEYGRVTSGAAANTDDIQEAASPTNLYFTPARVVDYLQGAISTVLTNDLTVNRALISNASGKIAVSNITSTELSHLEGVSSNIQTQINKKLATTDYIVRVSPMVPPDGSTSDFAFDSDGAGTPDTFEKEHLYLNGVLQNEDVDYEKTGTAPNYNGITFITGFTPSVDDTILMSYIKLA